MMTLQSCFLNVSSTLRDILFSRPDGEWTMHDTLRMHHPLASETSRHTTRVSLCGYDSEYDFEQQWSSWDQSRSSRGLNALVILNQQIQSDLSEVICRRHPARRLILTPTLGHWPGTDSAADLALSHNALGWRSIEVCRDTRLALQTATRQTEPDERLVIFWPAPLEFAGLLAIGHDEGVLRPVM
ncbi:hypothetical protein [Schlesneria sp. T3-172]|uniref:hypothetical protein n=1 Tax=Schlesneria sphaerica TaxID=3373610 RepID=UPI0037CB9581